MKLVPISKCEKAFVLSALEENIRLDGRNFDEYRDISIIYGTDWGSCVVSLGKTRVMAHVTCEVQAPKASRPSEGLLFINTELSVTETLYFEPGRQSDLLVQINRILEKCIRESRCIDLEALCIVADEKVWSLRLDLHLLNCEGNLIGCCSVAVLAALKHFRYPQFTVTDSGVVVHPIYERNPVPLTVRHFPLVLSYAFYKKGEIVIVDPSLTEEKVAESVLLLFINSYDEFCGMHLEGSVLPSSNTVLKCSNASAKKVKQLVDQIKCSVQEDIQRRLSGEALNGFIDLIAEDGILAMSQERLKVQISNYQAGKKLNTDSSKLFSNETQETKHSDMEIKYPVKTEKASYSIISFGKKSAELVDIVTPEDSGVSGEEMGEESDSEVELVEDRLRINIEQIDISDSSEEDDVATLNPHDLR